MSRGLPVFVFPNQAVFTKKDRVQRFTIYNPFDFTLKFEILSTKPQSFSVSSTDGTIRRKCCVDVVIRLLDDTREACFLIVTTEMGVAGRQARSGQKKLPMTLQDEEVIRSETAEEALSFQPVPSISGHLPAVRQYELAARTGQQTRHHLLLFYLIGVVCILILSLPTQASTSDPESSLPNWLHLTVSVKLVVAYILGIVTVTVIRP